jgi:hypothetical protein
MTLRSKLAAFKIDRRRISVAVFVGERLEFTDSRQLSVTVSKALENAQAYVDWIIRNFAADSAAFESSTLRRGTWKSRFAPEMLKQFRTTGIPLFEANLAPILTAFAHPPLRHRSDLRDVICSMWPVISRTDTDVFRLDAAALGLYIQIERMFEASLTTNDY